MTSKNENPFQTTASSSLYLGFTILLCLYGFPHLPTLPQKILSKLFFWKKYGSKIPYLPMVWTYVQTFVVFLFGTLSLEKPSKQAGAGVVPSSGFAMSRDEVY